MRPQIRVTLISSRRLRWLSTVQEDYIGGQPNVLSCQYGFRITSFRIPMHSQYDVLRPIMTIEVDVPKELTCVPEEIAKVYVEERLKEILNKLTLMFQEYALEHKGKMELIHNGLYVDVENGKLSVGAKQNVIDLLNWGDCYLTMLVKTDNNGKVLSTISVFDHWTDLLTNRHFLEKIKKSYGKGEKRVNRN